MLESTGGRSSSASSSSASQDVVACPVWPTAPVDDHCNFFGAASSSTSTAVSNSGSSITPEDETFLAEALLLEESDVTSHTKSHSEPARTSSSAATQMVRIISSNDCGVGSESLNCSLNPTESLAGSSSSSKKTLGKRVAAPDTNNYDPPRKKPTPRLHKNNDTREEKNAREKDRSLAISSKIQEIRELLTAGGGLQHPRITKNKVLSEAIEYTRLLQHRVVSLDRERSRLLQVTQHQLTSEFNTLTTMRPHEEGTWSRAIPPPKANGHMHDHSYYDDRSIVSDISICSKEPIPSILQTPSVERSDYRSIFKACPVGMAIASLGGQFVDCNPTFCQIAKSTKNEVCSTTLFLFIHKEDLQYTFDSLSGLVSSVENLLDPSNIKPCIVRGRLQQDHRIRIEVITGSDGTAHSFCVTFVTPPLVEPEESRTATTAEHESQTKGPISSQHRRLPMFPSLSLSESKNLVIA